MAGVSGDGTFDTFYQDLKATEKADSVLTSAQQIDRLLRPGSTYRNLNPYEVLQIDPETPLEEIRKKYKRLSILVHPDKNQDDLERSQAAFDAVKKAYSMLNEEETRKKCYELVEEARGRTSMNMEEKRKKLRKEAHQKGLPLKGEHMKIDEDDPEKYKHAVHILTMKLFADLERRRKQLENKISEEAGRKREAELAAEEKRNMEKEFAKNWEDSRQGRVNSWLNFTGAKAVPSSQHIAVTAAAPPVTVNPVPAAAAAGSIPLPKEEKKKKKKEKRFSPMGFRPPKHKPESR